jgi:hypothetical protein
MEARAEELLVWLLEEIIGSLDEDAGMVLYEGEIEGYGWTISTREEDFC